MENKLKKSEIAKLKKQMFKALEDLPQRQYIDDTHARAWIDQVVAQELIGRFGILTVYVVLVVLRSVYC